jgi:hypothetical protein
VNTDQNSLFHFLKIKIVKLDVEQELLFVPANLIELEHQGNEEPTMWLLDQGNLSRRECKPLSQSVR